MHLTKKNTLFFFLSLVVDCLNLVIDSLLTVFQYLGQRKKQEAEERRIKQKRAREDFTKMLEVGVL